MSVPEICGWPFSNHTQRAGTDDLVEKSLAGRRVEQPGLVIVGIGRHVGILGREIEERGVALQFLVLENQEGRVLRPITLHNRCRVLAESQPLRLNLVAF